MLPPQLRGRFAKSNRLWQHSTRLRCCAQDCEHSDGKAAQRHSQYWCMRRANVVTEDLDRLFSKKGASSAGQQQLSRSSN